MKARIARLRRGGRDAVEVGVARSRCDERDALKVGVAEPRRGGHDVVEVGVVRLHRDERDAMEVMVACSLFSRLRGLLGRGRYPGALLLVPCNDVHTFGMRYDIDVAFLAPDGSVLESFRKVGACRRLRCGNAYATIERISTDSSWLERGDTIELRKIVREATKKNERKAL